MRMSEIVRMADDGAGPVWARKSRRGGGGAGILGLLFGLLAIFGALMLVLSIMDRSVAEAGARVDGWLGEARGLIGGAADEAAEKAPEVAKEAADTAGKAVEKTGDALEAGAEKTAEELKKAG